MKTIIKILMFVVLLVATVPVMAQKQNAKTAPKTTVAAPTKKSSKSASKGQAQKSKPAPTAPSVNKLKSERDQIQKRITQSQTQLNKTKRDVAAGLSNLSVIKEEINRNQQSIGQIQSKLDSVTLNIRAKEAHLDTLNAELKERKFKYARCMVYLYQTRKATNKLLFLLASKDFRQLTMRHRYVKDYAQYLQAQAELVTKKQEEVAKAKTQLDNERALQNRLLNEKQDANNALNNQQTEQQNTINSLQQHQSELQDAINKDRKAVAAVNSRIDYYVQQAIERERKQREEEARRKAAAEEKKRKEAEKQKQQAAKQKKEAKQKTDAQKQKNGTQKQNSGSQKQNSGSQKQNAGTQKQKNSVASTNKQQQSTKTTTQQSAKQPQQQENLQQQSSQQQALSNNFAANKGRLPLPITGSYLITSHFGGNSKAGVNNGINITGNAGAQARCIFGGEVLAIFTSGGYYNVIVRHGNYLSAYCNLSSVSVSQGQKVSARQSLGAVARDASGKATLHFQLRRDNSILNPEQWLSR